MLNLLAGLVVLILALLSLSLAMSAPVWFLWNNCVVGIIGGTYPMTWLQAWGFTTLMALLTMPGRVKLDPK